LGNVTLTPIACMLTGRAARNETMRILRQKTSDALILLPLVGSVCVLTFWQSQWPLLFLPIMWIMLATFRLGRLGAALSLVILAVVGGVFTTLGQGPITLCGAAPGDRIQFFQFYLAATVLTVIPIAADLNSRRKLHRDLKRSEAKFRLLADHCTDVITRISVRKLKLTLSRSARPVPGMTSWRSQLSHSSNWPCRRSATSLMKRASSPSASQSASAAIAASRSDRGSISPWRNCRARRGDLVLVAGVADADADAAEVGAERGVDRAQAVVAGKCRRRPSP
jgi:hypothetical protein